MENKGSSFGGLSSGFLVVFLVIDIARYSSWREIVAKDGWQAWWTSGWAIAGYVAFALIAILWTAMLIVYIKEKWKK